MSRAKTEVCRYWLNNSCRKGEQCEFLHSLNYAKMPYCSDGDFCNNEKCVFKHRPLENRTVCANYQLGFCSFGRRCTHIHVPGTVAPEISPYWKKPDTNSLYAALLFNGGPMFRKKKCDYYSSNKWCPYFDMCNFDHVL